jgi:hypothetical protein
VAPNKTGRQAEEITRSSDHGTRQARRKQFWVKCDDLQCGCTTAPFDHPDKALELWNRRPQATVVSIKKKV